MHMYIYVNYFPGGGALGFNQSLLVCACDCVKRVGGSDLWAPLLCPLFSAVAEQIVLLDR
jgi:hypothetical protein